MRGLNQTFLSCLDMVANKRVLQISPFEPPASGWTKRIKLLRQVIESNGGTCEILDIGPSRKINRAGCVGVQSGRDYIVKLLHYARRHYTFHCHINAEYFRGLLLALAACVIARFFGNRVLTTFHGGTKQRDLIGWRRMMVSPFFRTIFTLSDSIICNSASEKNVLGRFQKSSKIYAIPAFSRQYLDFSTTHLEPALEQFLQSYTPLISVYLCFRDGFYTETVIDAIAQLVPDWPRLGLVIVGTGDDLSPFQERVKRANIEANVYFAGDMDHGAFLTLISRSTLHLRTPTTDGVSATVLEALALHVPVVASENGSRPSSVITYVADDPADLALTLATTLINLKQVVAAITTPVIKDTATEEVQLIFGNAQERSAYT